MGRAAGGVVMLGFDAGNPALVRRWAAEGHLPHFASVIARGASAVVEHEPGLYVGSIWPSVATGVGVDRHGFYTGIRPAPYSYLYQPAAPEADPFWVGVAQAGRRIAVVDVPFFRGVEGIDGLQLFEWGCHDRYFGPHSEPLELLDDVLRDVGRHVLGMIDHELGYERFAPCDWVDLDDGGRGRDERRAFVDTLSTAVEQRSRLSEYVRERGPFDLVVDIVGETHCAGHHLWSLHDPDHPDHDPALAGELGEDPLLTVYRRMDDLLGAYLEAAGEGDTTYVFLSHGMQAHFDGTHLFDEILWRLDQAYRGLPTPWVGSSTRRIADGIRRLPSAARPRAIGAARSLLRRRAGALSNDPTPPLDMPPPSERLWYQLENNTVTAALRYNRADREPNGLLSEAMTAHATRWLERELSMLVNLDSGRPVISEVYPSDRYYRRRDDDGLPDVLAEWVRDHPIERVWSPTIGFLSRPYTGLRTGDHDRLGEFIAIGPGLVPGRVGTVRSVDIAPTVAAATGVFLHDLDGRPIDGLVPGGSPTDHARAAVRRLDEAIVEQGRPSEDEVGASALRRELIDLRRRVHGLEAAHHDTRLLAAAGRSGSDVALDVLATSTWIRSQRVEPSIRFSVVMATRGRVELLSTAVGSVLAQTYPELELVVVDDASTDGSADWLATVEDDRLVVVRNERRLGEGGARNVGLDVACGDVVTFLDDDNAYDPDWLRSLAWLFQDRPEATVAYGARLVDDRERHHRRPGRGLPWLQLNEWDPALNRERCLVDVNVLAHRRGTLRFDPDLPVFTDWDYLLGLTRETEPVRLPVIATLYTTNAPDRATDTVGDREEELYRRVRDRWAARG